MRNRLKMIRAERGLTQLAVSLQTKIHLSTYQRLEADTLDPSPEQRAAINAALGLDDSTVWTDAPIFSSASE